MHSPTKKQRLMIGSLMGKLLLAFGAVAVSVSFAVVAFSFLGIDLKQRIERVFSIPRFSPGVGIWRDHPRYGWENRPDAIGYHKTDDFEVTYTIDSSGNRLIPVPEDPAGEIVLLGCSFTFGYGVNDDESYGAVLAKKYWPRIEVINRSANPNFRSVMRTLV